MNSFNPKVSIIMPVYNGADYLGEAIDSALAQTYKNIEIIVVNDGSTDDGATDKVARSYGDKIKYYKKPNGGVATALNLGIEKMTGEYFSWLSHDDVYKPFKVERQIEYLSGLKDKNVVLYSDYELMNEKGRLVEKRIQDHAMLERAPIYALLRGILNGITILVPKVAFKTHGTFDPALWCTQDYDLWHRLFNDYPFVHQPGILSRTRVHSKRETVTNPRVVTEGNVLWKEMIENSSDSVKISAEGSLFAFYFEMLKFIKHHTPYAGVIPYCEQQLEYAAQSKEMKALFFDDTKKVLATHKTLLAEGQRRAGAYLLENFVKWAVDAGKVEEATYVITEKLVGKDTGLSDKDIAGQYLPKIGAKSKKVRLMFCSAHWLTGGMERVMSILFEQLKDEYELFLLTPSNGQQSKIKVPGYVTHLKMSNELFFGSYAQAGLTYALVFDIDIAIGFVNLFGGLLDLYDLCAGTRVKTVASNHEVYFYPYHNPNYYYLISRRLDTFKKTDATLWLTNFSASVYGLVGDNSYLMPNPNAYKVHEIKPRGDKIILCVGRFNDYIKRVDRMLECFSLVSKSHPDAKLMLVGQCDRNVPILPGHKETINDLLKELRIDENKVIFVGEVGNVEEYYSQASVLLLTSESEGFGMVINEAACFGVPAVCNKIPGLEDLITDGENGFLTAQGDIRAMADAVTGILSDQKLHDRLGDNAQKMVARFDEAEIGKRWEYLVRTLLEKDQSVRHQKLGEALGYEAKSYKGLSALLFDELNKVVAVSIDDRNELTNPRIRSSLSHISRRLKHNYHRLHKAVKNKGVLRTGMVIAQKTYRKAKRLYKRP